MSELKVQILDATKAAMKARDKARLAVMRLITADIKRVEVDERRELSDDDVLSILNKMLKQRQDAFQQYKDAQRTDLADQEAYEMEVVREFLPEPLSEDELASLIASIVESTGAAGMQDMGKVMGQVKTAAAGRADMGKVSQLVKAALQG